ncbi:MAG: glutaredoxin family protein [Caldilineaceae bacterium]|nr:glutaredoxin family protein [Caldilineaceae bacterium]
MQITVYSKPNCSLCDTLMDDLAWLQRELDFTVISHNINDDPALKAQFQYLIPVVEIAGVLYNPPHDLLQMRQRLIAAARDNASA